MGWRGLLCERERLLVFFTIAEEFVAIERACEPSSTSEPTMAILTRTRESSAEVEIGGVWGKFGVIDMMQ